MEKKFLYIIFFGFLAGLVNCSAFLSLGTFVTHHTGSSTKLGVGFGNVDLVNITFFGGLIIFYIIGSILSTVFF